MFPILASTIEPAHGEIPLISPNPIFILPFVLLLACIALMPFIAKHWWEHHYPKVAVGLGLITTLYYWLGLGELGHLGHTMVEYFSFISLIGSLFVVSGGIHLQVSGQARPINNAAFLAAGAVLANIVGTTGASMLMIGPWIRMNRRRFSMYHTAFFIFVISNTAGCLTPIGDPPLFLGYLKGIPFFWTLQHLHIPWALMVCSLIVVFLVFDTRNYNRMRHELGESMARRERWVFTGLTNVIFLAIILGAVLYIPTPFREIVMLVAAFGSYGLTSKHIHQQNEFTFGPIKEVAWLFLGIFATMVPALDYLGLHARELGLSSPFAFYFATGSLSAVLDNAPTYLTFLSASVGTYSHPVTGVPLLLDRVADIHTYLDLGHAELVAISLGAVWFGAMTYIGNGPNLLVKAIIEQAGCPAPHFLEYFYRYSLPFLFPLLIILGMISLRIG